MIFEYERRSHLHFDTIFNALITNYLATDHRLYCLGV